MKYDLDELSSESHRLTTMIGKRLESKFKTVEEIGSCLGLLFSDILSMILVFNPVFLNTEGCKYLIEKAVKKSENVSKSLISFNKIKGENNNVTRI